MKKLLVIMLAVIMALSTAACGTVQSTTQTTSAPAVEVKPEVTPAPEVSEPAEAPKEESEATEVVEETPEVTEEPQQDSFDWLDYKGKPFSTIEINEYVDYDEPKVFYISTEGNLEAVLSNNETYVEDEFTQGTYVFYVPNEVQSMRCFCDKGVFEVIPGAKKGAVASGFFPKPETGEEVMFLLESLDVDNNTQIVRIFVTRE